MQDPNVTNPAPGNLDNLESHSGFTYLGQFIDHDLTLDLVPQPTAFIDPTTINNFETFRFDLSSLYGGGPGVSPQIYQPDGLHFLIQEPNPNGVRDVPRNADGTAILVEHRNDENQIISQVHTAFLKFHNAVVDQFGLGFADAQALVIKYYQWIVLNDFLPKIGGPDTVNGILNGTLPTFYKPGNPHRPENDDAHFNFPRNTDTFISKSLFVIPIGGPSGAEASGSNTLPFRNLVRGFRYSAPSGQDVASGMGLPVIAPTDAINPSLVPGFTSGTPLWYYILKESENLGGKQLGPVGGRIIADVFTGLMQAGRLCEGRATSSRLCRSRSTTTIDPTCWAPWSWRRR